MDADLLLDADERIMDESTHVTHARFLALTSIQYLLREVFSVSHFDKFIVVFFKFIKPNLKIPRC